MAEHQPKPMFQNGTQFIFANTERGPSLYSLLEGAWTAYSILQGLRMKVWEFSPDTRHPVAGAWYKMGLIEMADPEGMPFISLTTEGARVQECGDLFEYEFGMMTQQAEENPVTDPAKYEQLRKALCNYTREFQPELLDWALDGTPPDGRVLDLCGGAGTYALHALEVLPQGNAVLFDKNPGLDPANLADATNRRLAVITGNVLEGHPMFDGMRNECDTVVLSEILHCMGEDDRLRLLQEAFKVLKPGGQLIVVEQFPNLRLDWRLHDMTEEGECLSIEQVAYEVQALPLKPVGSIEAVSHFGIKFIKEAGLEQVK